MKKQNRILICIICISFVQMATNGISAILANIQSYYSTYSASIIQFLMTFPSLFIVLFTIVSAKLLHFFSKKKLIEFGLICVIGSGILSFVGHQSLVVLFVGAALLGVGVGFCASFAISLISDHYAPNQRGKIVGIQTAASNFGSMMMTFFGGFLALLGWHYNYFVYFLAIPGLLFTHFWLNDKKEEAQNQSGMLQCTYSFKICLLIILFMFFFYVGPTSIAMLLAENGYTNASLAGSAATLLLLGGTLSSLVFDSFEKKFNNYCLCIGFLLLAIGYICMGVGRNLIIIYMGCFLAGSSISFVMPKCMLLISMHEKNENVSIATAMAMASSNIGTLIAPVFTIICTNVFCTTNTIGRLNIAFIICTIIFVLGIVLIRVKGEIENGK